MNISLHEETILAVLDKHSDRVHLKCPIVAALGGSEECENIGECDRRLIKLSMNVPDPMTDDFRMNKFHRVKTAVEWFLNEYHGRLSNERFAHHLAKFLYKLKLLAKTQLPAFSSNIAKPNNPVGTVIENGKIMDSEIVGRIV